MKPRTIRISFGILILALALLACNLPSREDAAMPAPGDPPATQGAAPTAASEDACPAVDLAPNPSGLIITVTMAEDTSGEERTPVNPTTTYAAQATFHAVVAIVNAPAGTVLKAVWYAADTSGAAACNTEIDAFELVTDGTRNIDFNLTPESSWPAGSYRVEIYINNVLDQAVPFTVK